MILILKNRNNPQYLNGFKAIALVVKVVEAVNTVAVVTKFPVCKAVTISERLNRHIYELMFCRHRDTDGGAAGNETVQCVGAHVQFQAL